MKTLRDTFFFLLGRDPPADWVRGLAQNAWWVPNVMRLRRPLRDVDVRCLMANITLEFFRIQARLFLIIILISIINIALFWSMI